MQRNASPMPRFAESAIVVMPGIANFHNTAGEAWRRLTRHKRRAGMVPGDTPATSPIYEAVEYGTLR
jgi:hypothetical protein